MFGIKTTGMTYPIIDVDLFQLPGETEQN